MKFLIQRVREASVVADGSETGSIGQGFLVFIGVSDTDIWRRYESVSGKRRTIYDHAGFGAAWYRLINDKNTGRIK